jgi:REP element-mobilizing transposase RayT
MVRKKCDWYPGLIHHITCGGNRRSDLFKAEEDYVIFLAIVKEVMDKLPFELVVITGNKDVIARIMKF